MRSGVRCGTCMQGTRRKAPAWANVRPGKRKATGDKRKAAGTNVRPRGTYVRPKTVDSANMEPEISKSWLGLVVKVLDLKPADKLKRTTVDRRSGGDRGSDGVGGEGYGCSGGGKGRSDEADVGDSGGEGEGGEGDGGEGGVR